MRLERFQDAKAGRVLRVTYDSYSDMLEDVKRLPEDFNIDPKKFSSSEKTDPDWSGTKTYKDALDLAENGWPGAWRKMMVQYGEFDLEGLGRMFLTDDLELDTSGEYPDVGVFVQGDPEHMVSMHRAVKVGDGKVVEISFSMNSPWSVDESTWRRRGAAAMSLIHNLSILGFSVEVLAHTQVRRSASGRTFDVGVISFPILRADDVLDLDRLSFALGNQAVFRRLMFRVFELHFGINANSEPGYGSPYQFETSGADIALGDNWYNEIEDVAKARAFVEKAVKNQLKLAGQEGA